MLLARAARSTPLGLGPAARPASGRAGRVLPLVTRAVGPDPRLGPGGRRGPAPILVVGESSGPLLPVGVAAGDLACAATGHVAPLLGLTGQWIVVVGPREGRRAPGTRGWRWVGGWGWTGSALAGPSYDPRSRNTVTLRRAGAPASVRTRRRCGTGASRGGRAT